MTFSREGIEKMDEITLQKEVLLPLFQAMEFKDVQILQGNNELGKDLVMWKEDEHGDRVNYGVVVKAKKIDGKAAGTSSSASTILFQIQQCVNNSFTDRRTARQHKVDRCWVISSKEITKEAIDSIRAILENNNLDRITKFIDGTQLWEWVEQYLPGKTVWDDLKKAQVKLENISSDFRIEATTERTVYIYPKHSDTDQKPSLKFEMGLNFDKDTEDQKVINEFNKFVTTGSSVTIPKDYIENLVVPELLQSLGFQSDQITAIHLFSNPGGGTQSTAISELLQSQGISRDQISTTLLFTNPPGKGSSTPKSKELLVQIELECSDSKVIPLGNIELRVIKAGTEEITYTNDHQKIPWQVKFILNATSISVSSAISFGGLNVKQAYDAARFIEIGSSKGGILRIKREETGLVLFESKTNFNSNCEINDSFLRLLEKLVFIQNKTQIPIALPFEGITHKDSELIDAIEQILRTGTIPLSPRSLTMNLNRSILENLIKKLSGTDNGIVLVSQEEEQWKIFDVEIPMGKRVTYCREVTIPKENLEAINSALLTLREDETIPVQFQSLNNEPIYLQFPFWIEKNRQTNLL